MKYRHRFGLAAFVVCLLSAAAARADQFVLFDGTYTHDQSGSHKVIKRASDVPPNWKTPVDFTTGRAYLRLEVQQKPNETTASDYQICMGHGGGPYTCSPFGLFRTKGVVEWSQDLPKWWTSRSDYDWTHPPDWMRAVIRDTKNHGIDPGGTFDGAPDLGLYLPIDVHFTVWIVSKGAVLDRNGLPPALPRPDGGAATPAPDARPRSDVAPPVSGRNSDARAQDEASELPRAEDGGALPPLVPPTEEMDNGPVGPLAPPPQRGGGGCVYGALPYPSKGPGLALVGFIAAGFRLRRGRGKAGTPTHSTLPQA